MSPRQNLLALGSAKHRACVSHNKARYNVWSREPHLASVNCRSHFVPDRPESCCCVDREGELLGQPPCSGAWFGERERERETAGTRSNLTGCLSVGCMDHGCKTTNGWAR